MTTPARLSLSTVPAGQPTVRAIPAKHANLGDYAVEFGVNASLYVTTGYLTALRDAATAALEAGR